MEQNADNISLSNKHEHSKFAKKTLATATSLAIVASLGAGAAWAQVSQNSTDSQLFSANKSLVAENSSDSDSNEESNASPENSLASGGYQSVYRMYFDPTGEHLFTTNEEECKNLETYGWVLEGEAWKSPIKDTSVGVYRVYNADLGAAGKMSHHYTTSEEEVKSLTEEHGWVADNNGKPIFYSAQYEQGEKSQGAIGSVPVYRLYNDNLSAHHYTLSPDENESLQVKHGWGSEGIGWYAYQETPVKIDFADVRVKVDTADKSYTGSQITPTVEITGLDEGKDYIVEYGENIKVTTQATGGSDDKETGKKSNEGTIKIKGIGDYEGEKTYTFNIVKCDVSEINFEVDLEDVGYDATKHTPSISAEGLLADTDYTVQYGENTNAGKGTVTVTGQGNYTGTKTFEFNITPSEIDWLNATVDTENKVATGSAINPTNISIQDAVLNKQLVKDTDYTVSYGTNIQDTGTITIKGTGNYTGEKTYSFDIVSKSAESFFDNAKVDADGAVYTGSQITPSVTVDGLVENKDYKVEYGENINAGTGAGTVKLIGIGDYAGEKTLTFDIGVATLNTNNIEVNTLPKAYTGESIQPEVSIPGLELGKDFTVTYGTNTQVGSGEGKITVQGIGNYTGSQSYTFDITKVSIDFDKAVVDTSNKMVTGSEIQPTVEIPGLTAGTDYVVKYSNNTSVGTGNISITGAGNYTGDASYDFKIVSNEFNFDNVVVDTTAKTYTGKQITPSVTVDGYTEDQDYTVEYGKNTDAGTGSITIYGAGSYAGSKTYTFEISPLEIDFDDVDVDYGDKQYTGEKITPEVYIEGLEQDVDYKVTYGENTEVGKGTIKIDGIGNYTGSETFDFNIIDSAIDFESQFEVDTSAKKFTGLAINPTVKSQTLTLDKDYTVTYGENINVGKGTIIIQGIGSYVGTKKYQFNITNNAIDFDKATVDDSDKTYNGEQITPDASIQGLIADKDYTVEYGENIDAGTGTITLSGAGDYAGTKTYTFTINKAVLKAENVTGDFDAKTYNGTRFTPDVEVSVGGQTLAETDDYTVTYGGNTDAGDNAGTVTVKGKGNYTGSVVKSFNITPAQIDEDWLTVDDSNKAKTGSQITPVVSVLGLQAGKDYSIDYGENTNPGTDAGTITVKGNGNYTGEYNFKFTIVDNAINFDTAKVDTEAKTYTGTQISPDVEIPGLTKGENYEVIYGENINSGTKAGTITIKGVGDYAGEQTYYFDIDVAKIDFNTVTVDTENQVYTGSQITPAVNVPGLKEGVDYKVSYGENLLPGDDVGTIAIQGINNYSGSMDYKFSIKGAEIDFDTVNEDELYKEAVYAEEPIKKTVLIDGLQEGVDFKVDYTDNLNVGTATLTINGIGKYAGTKSYRFDITQAEIEASDVPDIKPLIYNAEEREPAVDVAGVQPGKVLTSGTDYTVEYSNNKNAGTATVVYTGIGNYTGTIKKTFEIEKAQLTVTGITSINKTYDTRTSADIVDSKNNTIKKSDNIIQNQNVSVTGFFGEDKNAAIIYAGATFDSKDANKNIGVSVNFELGDTINNNYYLDSLSQKADINPKPVVVESGVVYTDKEYDGSTDASNSLDFTNAKVVGTFDPDKLNVKSATGTFNSANVNESSTIELSNIELEAGSDSTILSNYVIAEDGNQVVDGQISQKEITTINWFGENDSTTDFSYVYDSTNQCTKTYALLNDSDICTQDGVKDTVNVEYVYTSNTATGDVPTDETVNVGTYTVGATKLDNDNYLLKLKDEGEKIVSTHQFEITKAPVTLTWTNTGKNADEADLIYNGGAQAPTVVIATGICDGDKTDGVSNIGVEVALDTWQTNANAKQFGDHTANAPYVAKAQLTNNDQYGNYEIKGEYNKNGEQQEYYIEQREITEQTWVGGDKDKGSYGNISYVYDTGDLAPTSTPAGGEASTNVNVVSDDVDTVKFDKYEVVSKKDTSKVLSQFRNTGDYVIKPVSVNDANYKLNLTTATKDYTITPQPLTLKWTNTELTYNGDYQTPNVDLAYDSGIYDTDKQNLKVSVIEDKSKQIDACVTNEITGYTAEAELSGTAAPNYTLNDEATTDTANDAKTTKFVINPKQVTLTWAATGNADTNNYTYTYSSFEQKPTCTVSGTVSTNDKQETLTADTIYCKSNSTTSTTTINVNEYKATVNGLTLTSGRSASNYMLPQKSTDVVDTDKTTKVYKIEPSKIVIKNPTASKTYDATQTSNLDLTNAKITGICDTDESEITLAATGTYDNKNAGSNKTVSNITYTFTTSDVNVRSNYVIDQTSCDQKITNGYIGQATLVVQGIDARGKFYDGTQDATLIDSSNSVIGSNDNIVENSYVVKSGFKGSDKSSASIKIKGTYTDKNAADDKNINITYTFDDNTKTNYKLSSDTPTTLTATISKINPTYTTPSGLTGKSGSKLSSISLSSWGSGTPGGTWAWNEPDTPLSNVGSTASVNEYKATYTPTDKTNYNTITTKLSVTVNPS